MNTRALLYSAVNGTGLLISPVANAQSPQLQFPMPSPTGTVKQRVGLTDIEISYSRPSAKGRPVMGGLLPYGEVWRTGANGRTTISFSTPVKLNDKDIPAGKYALFTIPTEQGWTVITNKEKDKKKPTKKKTKNTKPTEQNKTNNNNKDTTNSPFAYKQSDDLARIT